MDNKPLNFNLVTTSKIRNKNMLRLSIVLCSFYLLTPHLTSAMTDEQKAAIHAHFETIGKKCIKDNIITEDDIANLRARKIPSGPKAPCFLACMMKDMGVMDNDGMMQHENALELAKTVFNDGEEIKLIADYLHSCSHVNSESVSDGSSGCDRAMLAYKCMTENASQFGIML